MVGLDIRLKFGPLNSSMYFGGLDMAQYYIDWSHFFLTHLYSEITIPTIP